MCAGDEGDVFKGSEYKIPASVTASDLESARVSWRVVESFCDCRRQVYAISPSSGLPWLQNMGGGVMYED